MKQAAMWCAAIAAAASLLVAAGYRSRDPDSALYAKLSASLAETPPSRWIAPEWRGEWNQEGLFREHPVGILLVPAALIRAGFPPEQAAYVVNMLYQAVAIVLIPAVAAFVMRGVEARSLAWLLQLIPVAFVYRIRGNQEHPLLVCFLALLYATHRTRTDPRWIVVTTVAFCVLVLIKGAFALLGLAAAVLWAALIPRSDESARAIARNAGTRNPGTRNPGTWNPEVVWPWIGFAAAIVAAGVMMAIYEAVYVRTTGESFLTFYNATRLGASIRLTDAAVIPHALANAGWYVIRLMWFAAPWSAFAAGAMWIALRRGPSLDRLATRGLVWTAAIVLIYVAALSPALVRAERFVFPLYFVVGAVGIVAAIRSVPAIARLVTSADRYPSLPIAVWFVTFLLSFASRVVR